MEMQYQRVVTDEQGKPESAPTEASQGASRKVFPLPEDVHAQNVMVQPQAQIVQYTPVQQQAQTVQYAPVQPQAQIVQYAPGQPQTQVVYQQPPQTQILHVAAPMYTEKYCGPVSCCVAIVLGFVFLPLAFAPLLCPCDERRR